MSNPDGVVRSRLRALVATMVGAAVLLLVVYVAFLHTRWGQRIDRLAYEGRLTGLRRAAEATDAVLDAVSVVSLALVGGAIALVALVRDRLHLAIAAIVTILGACVSTEILKKVVFDQPALLPNAIDVNSFPSGHTTVGMVLSLALIMVSPQRHRAAATVTAAIVSGTLGVAVVTSGYHRPSDAIGAYCVSLFWATGAVAWILHRYGAGDDTSRRFGTRTLQILLFVGIALLFAVTAVVVGTLALRGELNLLRQLRRSYVAATTSIAATAILTVVGFNWLLRGLTLDASSSSGP